jgi:hypothetical protein
MAGYSADDKRVGTAHLENRLETVEEKLGLAKPIAKVNAALVAAKAKVIATLFHNGVIVQHAGHEAVVGAALDTFAAEITPEAIDQAKEAVGSGSERWGAGDWTLSEGQGLTDNTNAAAHVPTQAAADAVKQPTAAQRKAWAEQGQKDHDAKLAAEAAAKK